MRAAGVGMSVAIHEKHSCLPLRVRKIALGDGLGRVSACQVVGSARFGF